MRGKSVDVEFVSSFIQECISLNKNTPEEICDEALQRLTVIDTQLKLRTKLVDVLSHFNYKKKRPEIKKEPLSFDKINNEISTDVISIILKGNVLQSDVLDELQKYNENYKKELVFTLKQLFEANILCRDDNGTISKGINFDLYLNYNGAKHK